MTPHLQAYHIYVQFGVIIEDVTKAKQASLLSVSELIKSYSAYNGMHDQEFFDSELKYWQQVKEEINKL